MATRKSQLDQDIAESLASRGRPKIPTYTVQPRNLWRTWNFSTLPDAVAFGLTLNEPFDVSTNSGAIVWGWGQRPPSEAEVWGEKHRQRHPPTKTSHATKKRKTRFVHVVAETPSGYRWLRAHVRGATETPEGFAVTDEEAWAQSLAAAGASELGRKPKAGSHATKQVNPEYLRKTTVAGQLADAAWLRGGINAMDTELKWLRRNDADPVIISEFERLYHKQMRQVLPEQRLSR